MRTPRRRPKKQVAVTGHPALTGIIDFESPTLTFDPSIDAIQAILQNPEEFIDGLDGMLLNIQSFARRRGSQRPDPAGG